MWKGTKRGTRQNRHIHPYAIFIDIMKCFIVSCGLVFLIIFFAFEEFKELPLTEGMLSLNVLAIFCLLIFFLYVHELFLGSRWFCRVPIETISGIARKRECNQDDIAEYNRKVNAVHEAGHAVMAYLKEIEDFDVIMSYINPRVVTVQKMQRAEDIKNMILIRYSGAAAEELIFGNFHAGCWLSGESDFCQAVDLIKGYIVMTDPEVSKSMLDEELSEQIIYLSRRLWKETTNILSKKKEMIERLSEELLRKETLDKQQVEEVLSEMERDRCVENRKN